MATLFKLNVKTNTHIHPHTKNWRFTTKIRFTNCTVFLCACLVGVWGGGSSVCVCVNAAHYVPILKQITHFVKKTKRPPTQKWGIWAIAKQ